VPGVVILRFLVVFQAGVEEAARAGFADDAGQGAASVVGVFGDDDARRFDDLARAAELIG
jgi:hypothetical protein